MQTNDRMCLAHEKESMQIDEMSFSINALSQAYGIMAITGTIRAVKLVVYAPLPVSNGQLEHIPLAN